jgi:hypothetical protein
MNIASFAVKSLASGMSSAAAEVLPSRITIATMGTLGIVGGSLAGLPGAALGVTVGLLVVSPLINQAADAITVGVGKVSDGVKAAYHSTVKWVKQIIYYAVETVFGWLARWSDTSDWAKSVYARADEAYLQTPTGIKLQPLLHNPLRDGGGVAIQTDILEALHAQAVYTGQPVTEQNIKEWVTLGEHIVKALTGSKRNIQAGGLEVLVANPEGGKPIVVESSLYNVRAITWYIAAQALWYASLQKETLQEEEGLDKEELLKMAERVTDAATFVLPDKDGRVYKFISHATPGYHDNGRLLNSQSRLQEALQSDTEEPMALPVLDDSSRHLPGKARRLMVNALISAGGGPQRLAIQLQAMPSPTSTGQRSEGHEPMAWQALQRTTGFASKVMAAVDTWDNKPDTREQTEQQSRHHTLHQELKSLLKETGLSKEELNYTYQQLSNMPLLSLLQLFQPNDKHTTVQKELYDRLWALKDADYEDLKIKIADAIKEEAQGDWNEELMREGEEILVPIDMKTEDELRKRISENRKSLDEQLAVYTERRIPLPEQVFNTVIDIGVVAGVVAVKASIGITKLAVGGLASLSMAAWAGMWGATQENEDVLDRISEQEDATTNSSSDDSDDEDLMDTIHI